MGTGNGNGARGNPNRAMVLLAAFCCLLLSPWRPVQASIESQGAPVREEQTAHWIRLAFAFVPGEPTLNPVVSPTSLPVQTLSGVKDDYTSIWINGTEVIPRNESTTWSCEVTLALGVNRFEILSKGDHGVSSNPVFATIEYDPAPSPVTPLRADGVGSGTTVALNWEGYDEAAQGDIASYQVYAAEHPFSSVHGLTPIATLPKEHFEFTVTRLVRGTSTFFAVVAADQRGNANPVVTPVQAVPTDIVPPEPPTSLAVECFSDRLVFSWSPSADTEGDLAGYRASFNGSAWVTLSPNDLRFEPGALTSARSYPFKLAAVDSSGNASSILSTHGITLLDNPSGLTMKPSDGEVALSWSAVHPRELLSHYLVYVDVSPFSTVSGMTPRASATTTATSIAGLVNHTPYHFAVTAVNASGGERREVVSQLAVPEKDEQGPVISDLRFESAPLASGATLGVSGVFSVSVSDPAGIGRTDFLFDGALHHADTGGSSRSVYPWSILSVEEGSHTLTIRSCDTLGNCSSLSLAIQVAMNPPGPPSLTAPSTGMLTNKAAVTVSGQAERGTEVLVTVNGAQAASVPVDAAGGFSTPITLVEGENRIRAAARNRGGTGPWSGEVSITLDSTLPKCPENLTAQLLSGGSVRISWRPPAETAIQGYQLYRASVPFDSPTGAVRVNNSLITGASFDNLPPADGTYHYRAGTVDRAGNESDLSSPVSIVIDKTPPRATSIQLLPSGPFDPGSGRIGQGLVGLRLAVTEPLLTTPFLSITPQGGMPIAVDLTRAGETEYTGSFTLTEATPSGLARAVFSARDLAGNRGTEIDSGGTALIDTAGPSVTRITLQPPQPVRNDPESPDTLAVHFGLDEPSAGAPPQFSALLSGPGRSPVAIQPITRAAAQPGEVERWSGTFQLPADAGASEVETLQFLFRGQDDLHNASTRILAENRFQVYQGDLPPLDPPSGLAARPLPGGRVKLTWQPVPTAAGYQLYRKGPADSDFTAMQRAGTVQEIVDSPGIDGVTFYAVASVRRENGQEAVSGMSAPVQVVVDSVPPGPPRSLSLTLTSRGIHCTWQPPLEATEPVTYSLYRADGTEITTVEGLTPIITGIREATALDPKPSPSDHCYGVTAVDEAGNESSPSNSFYLNFGLLPVSSMKVVRAGAAPPVISWTPPSGSGAATIAGYNLDLASSSGTVRLNASLLQNTSLTDSGYSEDTRTYTVTAVDHNGVSSLGRSLSVPVVDVIPAQGEALERGVMNRLDFTVTNRSSIAVEHARLNVRIGSHVGTSESFALQAGEVRTASVSFGGYADLEDLASMTTTLRIEPNEGERIEISREDAVPVTDGMLLLRILTEDITRGGSGTVRFALENTGEEEIELVTATGWGASPSSDLSLTLRDLDGNVLSGQTYRQSIGSGVVTLANGSTVARIQPGESFTSNPITLAVPLATPDRVRIEMVVKTLYHHLGRSEQVAMQGLSSRCEATLLDTSYSGVVTSVSPEISNGEDVSITGKAFDRASGSSVAQAPLKLVITVNGFERTLRVLTDADGNFTHPFKPLPTESGRYTVFAVHPDVSDKPAQKTFIINRVSVTPQTLNLTLPRSFEKSMAVQASAGDGTVVHNVRLVCEAPDQPEGRVPEGVHLTVGAPLARLASRQSGALQLSVWGDNSAPSSAKLVFQVKSDESGGKSWGTVTVNLQLSQAQPALFFTPSHIETGVSFGGAVSETVVLENRGLADLTAVSISLVSPDGSPAPSWAHLNVETAIEAIAVGEKRPVGLSFTPTEGTVSEGVYPFHVRIESPSYRRTNIPVFVTVTQSGSGNALFKVSDIYTGTVDPKGRIVQGLSGASITVQNEQVPTIQHTLKTDTLGEALFTQLPAGRYKVKTTATNHQEQLGRVWVKPGITSSEAVFLEYNLVTVEWEVVETTLQDRYEIVLTATFEANVPAAVVVAEPASVHLPSMKAGDVYHGEFSLGNFGLIRADNLRFTLPAGGEHFKYELLSPVPPSLAAKSRVTIPYRVTCLRSFNPAEDGPAGGGGCSRSVHWGRLAYDYTCASGALTTNTTPACIIADLGGCGSAAAAPGAPGSSTVGGAAWTYVHPGGGGMVGPAPAPAPTPLEGSRCLPTPPRNEEDPADCRPETRQDQEVDVGSSVHCLLREYRDNAVDLVIKAPGANLTVSRTYAEERWQFEDTRQHLKLTHDALGQSVVSIHKAGVLFEREPAGSETVFAHGSSLIRSLPAGYLWENKHGDWQSFDAAGRMTAFGTGNGTTAKLLYEASGSGRLETIRDRNERTIFRFEYNGAGERTAAVDLDGRRVEYGYAGGKLVRVKNALGSTTTYEYNTAGKLAKKTDPLGRSTSIAYDRFGTLTKVTDGRGLGHSFHFDYDSGRKEFYARIQTPAGTVKEVWYDRLGDTRRVDVNGSTVRRITRDGRALLVTDEAGNVTRKDFDEWGNPTRILHPDGTTVTYEYERRLNRPVRVTDERGGVTLHGYDEAGNLVLKTEAAGTAAERTTELTYDSRGLVTSVKGVGDDHTEEAVAVMEYDASGNLTSVRDPEGGITRFTHDARGNILTRTDPLGKVFRFTYDAVGRLTSSTDPMGHEMTIRYDAVGNVVERVDAEGRASAFEYDDHNRLVRAVDTGGNAARLEYDRDGRLTRHTDPEGKALAYRYDARGRLAAAVDGSGNEIRLDYADNLGCSTCRGGFDQPARITYPTFVRELQYDSRGRKIREEDVLSETERTVTRFEYDEAGSLITLVDRESRITRYVFDPLGRLSRTLDPLGGASEYAYNDRDALLSFTDANGSRMRFEYDRNNRLTRETRPMGQETSYAYDPPGRLIRQTDPKGQSALYHYDDAGRLAALQLDTAAAPGAAVKTVTFSHDKTGNLTGYDDGLTSAVYTFDDAYRKVQEVLNYGPFQLSSSMEWYRNGAMKSFTGPNGITVGYTYDEAGRPSTIEIPGSGIITYNGYHWLRPAKITLPGGGTRHYGYDPLMRLKTLEVKSPAEQLLLGTVHGYDKMDNLVSRQTEHGDYHYGYDDRYRLIQGSRPGLQPESFTYDGVGNRLTAEGFPGTFTYNPNSELLGHGSTTYLHDENGNTRETATGSETLRYHYDAEDQLERVETGSGAVIARYGHDPFGRRLWKEAGGRKTYFHYAEEGLVGEYDETGAEIKSYGYRPGSPWTTDPLFMKQGSETYFYQNDHLGTPALLTAAGGSVVWSAKYSVFGEATIDPASSVINNLRSGGQYFDAETGLHYNYHRTYHPGLGRYLQVDPLGIAGGPNPYASVLNPANEIDPLGLSAFSWSRAGEGFSRAVLGAATGLAIGVTAVAVAPALAAAIPCSLVSAAALVGSAGLGWRTGEVLTGRRIDFSLSDWRFHVRRMCDGEQSSAIGELAVEWATFGLGAMNQIRFCFEAGAPVMTDRGRVPIESIRLGDRVLTLDDPSGQPTYRPVTHLFQTPDQPIYELTLTHDDGSTETFRSTGDHPLYLKGTGWTRAADLLPGDEVFTSLGGWLRVSSGTWTTLRTTVYNLEVDHSHSYFVGQSGVWVHNVCAGFEGKINITKPYRRPSRATTKAQREAVQGQPCVDCGRISATQIADHKKPLVVEYYENGNIDYNRMLSIEAIQPQCPTCSASQGGILSHFSRKMKKEHGL